MKFLNFRKSVNGNIAVISALSLFPIIVTAGGVIDLAFTMNKLSEVRQGTNASVLALANPYNFDTNFEDQFIPRDYDSEGYVRRMMSASVPNFEVIKDFQIDIEFENEIGYKNYKVSTSGYVETNFLRMMGVDKIPFDYTASASHRVQTAEISLVLDISSSMSGNRLPQLRSASKTFIDMVFGVADPDSTSISIVPFGGTVNLGPDIFNKFAADLGAPTTILDPTEAQYDALENEHQTTQFRFTSDYYCLEFPSEDYEDPDAMLTRENYSQVSDFWSWSDFHSWCPTRGSESVFVSQDTDKLHQVLDRMQLSDGTGTDVGVLWGYKALSPNWRGEFGSEFSDRPIDYNTESNVKSMVIMTDGGITYQARPTDPERDTLRSATTVNPPLDYDQPIRRGGSGSWNNRKFTYSTGNRNASQNFGFDMSNPQETAVDHFLRVCQHARDNGIVVYTISFNLSETSWANQLMQECATDIGKHYLVNNLEIEDAFSSIAGSISALRMTG